MPTANGAQPGSSNDHAQEGLKAQVRQNNGRRVQKKLAVLTSGGDSAGMNAVGECNSVSKVGNQSIL